MEEQQVSTVKVILSVGGAAMPDWFMQELTSQLGYFMAAAKQRYQDATGNVLDFLPPSAEDVAQILGKDPAELAGLVPERAEAGIMTIRTSGPDDASDMVDIDPDQFEDYVQMLMEVAEIDYDQARAICESGIMPDEVKEKIVAKMVERGHFSPDEAREALERGREFDEYGATKNCQCEGCKARRAAVQEKIEAQRAARFN